MASAALLSALLLGSRKGSPYVFATIRFILPRTEALLSISTYFVHKPERNENTFWRQDSHPMNTGNFGHIHRMTKKIAKKIVVQSGAAFPKEQCLTFSQKKDDKINHRP
ncbi:MAG: hypothetical protein EON51_18540 [Acinetobacter sp.]|nr:MAG: hypothetical protein EON51_18540 [Acinetobacter sp.]